MLIKVFYIIFIILIFPFFVWLVGYVNSWFLIPFFREEDAKDFLSSHGYEFISSKEIKDDGFYKIEESLISKFYSYKTYYRIDATSITDGSKIKFRLILSKSFRAFGYKRDLHFFEDKSNL